MKKIEHYSIDEIKLKINLLKRSEQLLFVDFTGFSPLQILKHFEFAGYDIIFQGNSIITNYFSNNVKLNNEDITKYGLIQEKGY